METYWFLRFFFHLLKENEMIFSKYFYDINKV